MKAVSNGHWLTTPGPLMSNLPRDVVGVFETLRWRNGAAEFWPEHWARFQGGCRWFKLDVPVSEPDLLGFARQLVAENRHEDAVVRYAAWRGADGETRWRLESAPPRPHMFRPEFNVTIGPMLPAPDPSRAYKHLDRDAWFDPLIEARGRGFDEVLLRDRDHAVVEGAVSNVFVVRHSILQTPALSAGPLPGVVRAATLVLARTLGWTVAETPITPDDLASADEVWLTNSLIGLRPVRTIDERPLPTARPLLELMRSAWQTRHGWDPSL